MEEMKETQAGTQDTKEAHSEVTLEGIVQAVIEQELVSKSGKPYSKLKIGIAARGGGDSLETTWVRAFKSLVDTSVSLDFPGHALSAGDRIRVTCSRDVLPWQGETRTFLNVKSVTLLEPSKAVLLQEPHEEKRDAWHDKIMAEIAKIGEKLDLLLRNAGSGTPALSAQEMNSLSSSWQEAHPEQDEFDGLPF